MSLRRKNSKNKSKNIASSLKNKEEELSKEIPPQNDGGALISQKQYDKLKKKNKTKIIILIICAVIILSFVITGILLFVNRDNEGSVFYKLLRFGEPVVPQNLYVEDFDQQNSFEILLRWNKVFNATNYTVEYIYGLYPDKVETIDAANNGIRVSRKRGFLKYRVRANNGNKTGEFSDWQTFYIESMQLDALDINKIEYNQEGNMIEFSWEPVYFKYYNAENKVLSYELIDAQYWKGDDPDYTENPSYYTPAGQSSYDFIVKKTNGEYIGDYLVIKIRPINYTVLYMGEKLIHYDPLELYELYGVTDNWVEIEIEIQKN